MRNIPQFGQRVVAARTLARGLLFLVAVTAAQPASSFGLPREYQAITGREAIDAAARSGKPIVIYFAQPGCGWCEKVEDLLESSKLRPVLVDSYHFVNVNIARSNDPVGKQLQQMLKVRGTPAFAALSPKGVPLCMIYGNIPDDDELGKLHANIQALNKGGKSLVKFTNGMVSCRGKVSVQDEQVSEIVPSATQ